MSTRDKHREKMLYDRLKAVKEQSRQHELRAEKAEARIAELEAERDRLAADCAVMRERLQFHVDWNVEHHDDVSYINSHADIMDRKALTGHPGDKLLADVARLRTALEECEEYFDQRADIANYSDETGHTYNEEMKLLMEVRQALSPATGAENAQVQNGADDCEHDWQFKIMDGRQCRKCGKLHASFEVRGYPARLDAEGG